MSLLKRVLLLLLSTQLASSCCYFYFSDCYATFDQKEKTIAIETSGYTTAIREALREIGWTVTFSKYYSTNDDVNNGKDEAKKMARYSLMAYRFQEVGFWLIPPTTFNKFGFLILDNKTNSEVLYASGIATHYQIAANMAKDIQINYADGSHERNEHRTALGYWSPSYDVVTHQ